jgi:membrane protease YdiL (CAAX protease family)
MSNADDNDRPAETALPAAPPTLDRSRLPGPGLGESILWIVGFIAVQLAALVGLQVAVQITFGGDPSEVMDQWSSDAQLLSLVLPLSVALLVLIPAAAWRLQPEPLRKLNFALPSLTQFVTVLATTVAAWLFCNMIQGLLQPVILEWLKIHAPDVMKELESMDIEHALVQLRGASTAMLLFAIALLPAVTEELLFRGVIGRGLIARWGKVMGVGLTTLLFAVVHGYPPTVVALIPLAILMHVAYLTTRSIWAPMLVHFVNNALSVLMLKYGEITAEAAEPESLTTENWIVFAVSGAITLCGMCCLRSARTQYLDADGLSVAPAYPTVEAPPRSLGLRRTSHRNTVLLMLFTALLIVEGYVVWTILQPDDAAAGAALLLPALHP